MSSTILKKKRRCMTQVMHLLSMHEALGSIPSTTMLSKLNNNKTSTREQIRKKKGREVAQIMHTHVSKCKNVKRK
jgi:hypothetical protein